MRISILLRWRWAALPPLHRWNRLKVRMVRQTRSTGAERNNIQVHIAILWVRSRSYGTDAVTGRCSLVFWVNGALYAWLIFALGTAKRQTIPTGTS